MMVTNKSAKYTLCDYKTTKNCNKEYFDFCMEEEKSCAALKKLKKEKKNTRSKRLKSCSFPLFLSINLIAIILFCRPRRNAIYTYTNSRVRQLHFVIIWLTATIFLAVFEPFLRVFFLLPSKLVHSKWIRREWIFYGKHIYNTCTPKGSSAKFNNHRKIFLVVVDFFVCVFRCCCCCYCFP